MPVLDLKAWFVCTRLFFPRRLLACHFYKKIFFFLKTHNTKALAKWWGHCKTFVRQSCIGDIKEGTELFFYDVYFDKSIFLTDVITDGGQRDRLRRTELERRANPKLKPDCWDREEGGGMSITRNSLFLRVSSCASSWDATANRNQRILMISNDFI